MTMTRKTATERDMISTMRRRAIETGISPSISITERLQAALCILVCDDLIDNNDDDDS